MEAKPVPAGGLTLKEDTTIGFVGAKVTGDHSGGFTKISASADVKDGKLVLSAVIDLAFRIRSSN